jgi:hypothetical protein
LSIQADIPKFFGQFAGVLIMLSLIRGLRFLASANNPTITRMGFLTLATRTEQRLISIMMLVAGLVAVIGWGATFPTGETSWCLRGPSSSPRWLSPTQSWALPFWP